MYLYTKCENMLYYCNSLDGSVHLCADCMRVIWSQKYMELMQKGQRKWRIGS